MRSPWRALLVAWSALALPACMKEGAVDVTGDGHEDLAVTYDDLLWAPGGDDHGSIVAVPVVLTNLSDADLGVQGWDVVVRTDDGRTCRARTSRVVRVPAGRVTELVLAAPCGPQEDEPEGTVQVEGTLRYNLAGRELRLPLQQSLELVG